MPYQLVDAGSCCRSLQCENSVALGSDATYVSSDAQGYISFFDDSRCSQAASDCPVSRTTGLLTENERQRTLSAQATLLMEDSDFVLAECLFEAVPCGVP